MMKWDYSWDPAEFKSLPDQEREHFMTEMITSLTRYVYAQHIKRMRETDDNAPRLKRSTSELALSKEERLSATSMPEEFAEFIDMATSTSDLSTVISKATMTIERGLRKFTDSVTAMHGALKEAPTSKDDSPINYRSRSPIKRSSNGSTDKNLDEPTSSSVRYRSPSPKKRTTNAKIDVNMGRSTSTSIQYRTSSPTKQPANGYILKDMTKSSTSPVKCCSKSPMKQAPNGYMLKSSHCGDKHRTLSPMKQIVSVNKDTTMRTSNGGLVKYRTLSPTKTMAGSKCDQEKSKPPRWRF